ncbi:MAG TPA: ChuX/HutX family heme-like substrate-binding protein [Burkholderiales bacterium]|nr:ChuX/HutX family heme-like substrate-binding protein [Burkholderiales bacterium]
MMPAGADIRAASAGGLLAAWEEARAQGRNNRAAAAKLGRSEAELIASGCGRFVTRLRPDALALLHHLPTLGEIKAVVRNPTAVIERAGTVRSIELNGVGAILVEADHFEMACQSAQWNKAFALREKTERGLKLSLQFFTAEGISAAKFFLRPGSDLHALRDLVRACASPDQSPRETIEPRAPEYSLPLQRPAPVAPGALLAFLQAAAGARHALTFVARNRAACLSTDKAVERVKRSDRGGWVNVLDEGMDIHLHDDRIRYLRSVPDPHGDCGWFHWFSERQAIALSLRCGQGWETLAQAAGVQPE